MKQKIKTVPFPRMSLRELQLLRVFLDYPVGTAFRFCDLQQMGVTSTYENAVGVLNRLLRRQFVAIEWWNSSKEEITDATDGGAVRRWKITMLGVERTLFTFAQLKVDLTEIITNANTANPMRVMHHHSHGEIVIAQVLGYYAGIDCQRPWKNPYVKDTPVYASWLDGFRDGITEVERDRQYLAKLIGQRRMQNHPKRERRQITLQSSVKAVSNFEEA
jgi:hypothetical protein